MWLILVVILGVVVFYRITKIPQGTPERTIRMLSWIMPKTEIKEPVVKPSTEAMPQFYETQLLEYADSLRKGEKPTFSSLSAYIKQMAALKGWQAEAMLGITEYLKSVGFRPIQQGPVKAMKHFDSGIVACVWGNPHGIPNDFPLWSKVCFSSDNPREPTSDVLLSLVDGEYSIDSVAECLRNYKEQLKWFRNKRR